MPDLDDLVRALNADKPTAELCERAGETIERLRTALDRITVFGDDSPAPTMFPVAAYQYGVNDMAAIARAALSPFATPVRKPE